MTTDEAGAARSAPRQLLTFSLGDARYGVDILRVKEIRGFAPVTRIPHSPPHVLGVLNLRGAIVPVIDLRLRFALAAAPLSPLTVIVVLTLRTAAGSRDCGVVVDAVSDVIDVAADAVKPAPALRSDAGNRCIAGITTAGDDMLIVLDVDELVTQELRPADTAAAA